MLCPQCGESVGHTIAVSLSAFKGPALFADPAF